MRFVAGGVEHRHAVTAYEREHTNGHCWRSGNTVIHTRNCRPARPLCRWMREAGQPEKYGPCECGAYPWPHRRGSGRCGKGLPPWPLDLGEYEERCREGDEEVPF